MTSFQINKSQYQIGSLSNHRLLVKKDDNRLGQKRARQIASLYNQCREYEIIHRW